MPLRSPSASRPHGSSLRPSHACRRGLHVLIIAVMALAGALVSASEATADPVDVGYRDFLYGSGASAPTGMKPESKLWYTQDNIWWGSLYNRFTSRFEIYKFDRSLQSWSPTNAVIDPRRNTQADTLYDTATGKLYVVSHVKSPLTTRPADISIDFMRYSYSPASGYTLDAGFPVEVATMDPEGAVFDRDTTGKFWLTWTEPNASGGLSVRVTHSTGTDGLTWVAPYDLPVSHASTLGTDEMSTLVAYNGKIGVMWGNENDGTVNWAAHVDGAADTTWSLTVLCDFNSFKNNKCPDDHMNVKSLDADGTGRVFAVVKTSLNDGSSTNPTDPLEIVWAYNPATNKWTRSTAWTVADNVTRAITLLDTSNKEIHVFAAAPCCSGGIIYRKKSSYDVLDFSNQPGLGTPFIQSSLDPKINNITSTKQSVNNNTGLLVLGGDDSTRYYLHNYLQLGPDNVAPAVTGISPSDGATGVATTGTTVRATFSEPMATATINSTNVVLTSGGSTVPASVTYDGPSLTAVLTPSTALVGGTTYTATVRGGAGGVTDLAGNALASNVSWGFTTTGADNVRPTVIDRSPADGGTGVATIGTTVRATFSEPMAAATITADNVTLTSAGSSAPVTATVTYDGSHAAAVLTPSTALIGSTTYTATVRGGAGGVTDLAGNELAADVTWTFATAPADVTAPTVTDESPASGATSVPVTTPVTATFSEAMDPATITASRFVLASGTSAPVDATVSYNASTLTATLTPATTLAEGTTYNATVRGGSGGVTDLAGNALAGDLIWTFTTVSIARNVAALGEATSTTLGTMLTLTTSAAAPGNSLIVLGVGYSGAPGVAVSVSSPGITWQVDGRKDNGTSTGTTSAIASARAPAAGLPAGTSITVTLTASATYRMAAAYAYSGLTTIGGYTAGTGTNKTPSSGPLSAQPGNLLFGVTVWNSGTGTHTATGGNTELTEVVAGNKRMAIDQIVASALGTYEDSGTLSSTVIWTDSMALYR